MAKIQRIRLEKQILPYGAWAKEEFGFINAKGEWVIEPQFEGAKSFSEGMAALKAERSTPMELLIKAKSCLLVMGRQLSFSLKKFN